jgi:hypothetical protein
MIPALLLVGLIAVVLTWFIAAISKTTLTTATERPSTGGRSPSGPFVARASYRTKDGTQDYAFRFQQAADGTLRVYIQQQPGYNGRQEDSHSTHRLQDSEGRYICWSVPITTYDDAKQIAARWAEATEKYRNKGKRF